MFIDIIFFIMLDLLVVNMTDRKSGLTPVIPERLEKTNFIFTGRTGVRLGI